MIRVTGPVLVLRHALAFRATGVSTVALECSRDAATAAHMLGRTGEEKLGLYDAELQTQADRVAQCEAASRDPSMIDQIRSLDAGIGQERLGLLFDVDQARLAAPRALG